MVQTKQQLQHALKEWAIAVEALTAGKTIILLRKGGIKEKSFQVKHSQVWLYPTYEHQKPQLLKPEYAQAITPVESGWHPTTLEIKSCGVITDVLPMANKTQIESLLPYHVWNEQMINERLKWKPQQPVMVMLLRVYCLPQLQIIPYSDAYGGCKSWIDLEKPISTTELIPVIENQEYDRLTQQIKLIASRGE